MAEELHRAGRILIVDDVLINLRLLAQMLTKHGYQVYGFDNGTDALIEIVRIQPDLILLDIMMPDIDGFTLCQRLKSNERTKDIPVIFISALNHVANKVKAFSVGGVDFISKPFEVQEILARIETHLKFLTTKEGLQNQLTTLYQSNADLNAFAHTIAHDLKQPLSSIMLGFELIQHFAEEAQVDTILATIKEIKSSTSKLTNIIDEMLLFASMQRDEIIRQPLDMGEIVEQANERLSLMIDEYNAEIILPQTWPIAEGYGPWVEEIWVNYISNALKYGGNPPLIHLGGEIQDEHMIKFWVQDNGSGIPESKIPYLFKEFQRVTDKTVEGHGLGLSIVKRIASKLGGQVGVESELGEGSTFSFTLPGYLTKLQRSFA